MKFKKTSTFITVFIAIAFAFLATGYTAPRSDAVPHRTGYCERVKIRGTWFTLCHQVARR